jgi:hypothetical protein
LTVAQVDRFPQFLSRERLETQRALVLNQAEGLFRLIYCLLFVSNGAACNTVITGFADRMEQRAYEA